MAKSDKATDGVSTGSNPTERPQWSEFEQKLEGLQRRVVSRLADMGLTKEKVWGEVAEKLVAPYLDKLASTGGSPYKTLLATLAKTGLQAYARANADSGSSAENQPHARSPASQDTHRHSFDESYSEREAKPSMRSRSSADESSSPRAANRAGAGNNSTSARTTERASPAPRGGDARRGPCEQCDHRRGAESVARLTFSSLGTIHAPKARAAQVRKTKEEREGQGEFLLELENMKHFAIMRWSRRPTGFAYCGSSELEGVYDCCETKNADQVCREFVQVKSSGVTRSCQSCEHFRIGAPEAIHILRREIIHLAEGRKVLDNVTGPSYESKIEDEYQECVDNDGIVFSKPNFLPYCSVLSDQQGMHDNYLVGPVVNSQSKCPEWQPRTEIAESEFDRNIRVAVVRKHHLNARYARLRGLQEELNSRKFKHFDEPGWNLGKELRNADDRQAADSSYMERLAFAGINAQCDIVAICLRELGEESDVIQMTCDTLWHRPWNPSMEYAAYE